MSESLQLAPRLNNQGVEALLEGQSTAAIQIMAESIKILKPQHHIKRHCVSGPLCVNDLRCERHLPLAQSFAAKCAADDFAKDEDTLVTVEIPGMKSSEDDCILFNQALRISSKAVAEDDLAFISFNLALACHQTVLVRNDYTSYVRAETLYMMALRSLQNCSTTTTSSSNTAPNRRRQVLVDLITLATINNLALLRMSNGDCVHAIEALDNANTKFLLQRVHNNGSVLQAHQQQPHAGDIIQALLMNVFLLKAPQILAPAEF